MTRRIRFCCSLAFAAAALLISSFASAQEFGPAIEELTPIDRDGKVFNVSALLFGDAFTIPGHHLDEFEGEYGWWTRRIYFTTDFLNFGLGRTSIRLRLEANQKDDFTTDYKSTLKDAYIQFRPGNHRIWLGRVPTLTFSSVEAHWNYRWFEKTPLDIQGTNSRLDGVRAVGPLTSGGPFYYQVAAGRSSDVGFETDSVSKGQLTLSYLPEDHKLFASLYMDYLEEDEVENQDTAWSFQVFGGWNGVKNYAGLHYFQRQWDKNAAEKLRVASFYWVHNFHNWHLSFVGRADRLLDPSVKANNIDYIPFDPTAKATAIFAGIDIDFHEYFRLMPNIKYVTYDTNDQGIRPDDDVYLNLTLLIQVP